MAHPEETKHKKPRPNLNPAIKLHYPISRYHDDVVEFGPVYAVPGIANHDAGRFAVDDVASGGENDNDHSDGHCEEANEA